MLRIEPGQDFLSILAPDQHRYQVRRGTLIIMLEPPFGQSRRLPRKHMLPAKLLAFLAFHAYAFSEDSACGTIGC